MAALKSPDVIWSSDLSDQPVDERHLTIVDENFQLPTDEFVELARIANDFRDRDLGRKAIEKIVGRLSLVPNDIQAAARELIK